ncbi:MAG: sigma-70 family RNA polymerase sigma factor [Exilispira sp.]
MDTKKILFENLTDFELNSLINSAKKGDNLSFEKILDIFKPIINYLASRFEINPSYKEDLIQEGIIGLYHAVNKYDSEKSNNFGMYAYFWIKQAISRMADKSSSLIRIPIRKFQKIRKLKKYKQLKNENYNELVDCNFSFISLDNDNKNIDDLPLSEKIPTNDNPVEHIENLLNYEDFNYLLSQLNERERDIIEKRYGLTTYIPLTLKEIAHQYKLTSESIRKIEIQALNKMKKTFQTCVDS